MGTAPTGRHSRLGKRPLPLPSGVQASIAGTSVTLKGPKGELKTHIHETVEVSQSDAGLVVAPRAGSGKRGTQYQGLAASLLKNAVEGVSQGYKVSMDLYGVGYRAELKGADIHLTLGLSHPVHFTLPGSVKARVETIDEAGIKRPRLHLESYDKAMLGQVAARIRSFRPPEPYKGKGVRFTGERIREKAGKAGAKSA